MKVPISLLDGMGGKKNKGVTLFAIVLMGFAGIFGLVWGIFAKFATPEPAVSELYCPSRDVPQTTPTKTKTKVERFASHPCKACGRG